MNAGSLVPDDMIIALIQQELQLRKWIPDTPFGPASASTLPSDLPAASFILDGFPRTARQAARLDGLIPINLAVMIRTPPEIILSRISTRWVHAPSGRVYNTNFNKPIAAGLDDVTGEILTKRLDDNEDVWKGRLKAFDENVRPLLDYYEKKGVLLTVEGNSSDEITPMLLRTFEDKFA